MNEQEKETRRVEDARKAGRALDAMQADGRWQSVQGLSHQRQVTWLAGYDAGYKDAIAQLEVHHNRHYGVPDQDANDLAALNRGYAKEARRQQFAVGNDPLTGVPVCKHGDDVEACQLAHHKSDSGVQCVPCPFCGVAP